MRSVGLAWIATTSRGMPTNDGRTMVLRSHAYLLRSPTESEPRQGWRDQHNRHYSRGQSGAIVVLPLCAVMPRLRISMGSFCGGLNFL